MKKISLLLIAFLMFIGGMRSANAMTLKPTGVGSGKRGDEISLYVTLNRKSSEKVVSAIDGIFSYDSNVLELVETEVLMEEWTNFSGIANNKTFSYANLQFNNLITSTSENIVRVVFKINDDAAYGNTIVSVSNPSATDEKGDDVVISGGSHTVKVLSDINTLSNLLIDGEDIGLEENTSDYDVVVNTNKINISFVKTDENSTVNGDIGDVNIHYGTNQLKVIVTSESGIERVYNINVYKEYKFTSDIYVYSEEGKYIYTGNVVNAQDILDSIQLPQGISKKIDNNKLVISYEEEVLKEYVLINVNSEIYDLSKSYIYIGNNSLDVSKISVTNGQKEVIDNKLLIKYGSVVIDEYELISISSEVYDLNKDYIYVGNKSLDLSKINVINAEKEVSNNKLLIKYDDVVLDEYEIAKFNSEFVLLDNYIYVGIFTDQNILSKVDVVNCTKEIINNNLQIKYNGELIDEYKLVRVTSSSLMFIDNNRLYVGNKNNQQVKDELNLVNADVIVNDNNIELIVSNKVITTIDKLFINFGSFNVVNKVIFIDKTITYNQFVNNITNNSSVSYKLIYNNNEVSTGNISDGSVLEVYYNKTLLDSFTLSVYNLHFSSNLVIDNNNKYIKYLQLGTNVSYLLDNINVSGNNTMIVIYDDIENDSKKNENDVLCSGDVLTIYIDNEIKEQYQISVTGDVDGNGLINLSDIMKVANYVYKDKSSLEGEYLEAADYDMNNYYDLQDIMKLANKRYKEGL